MIMDGAMGTMIQQRKLEEKDFRGAPVNVQLYNLMYGMCMHVKVIILDVHTCKMSYFLMYNLM